MAIKNITSTIKPEKTIMEIEQILAKFGAKAILKEYDDGNVSSISFYILSEKGEKIPFRLPMNLEKARAVIIKAVDERKLTSKFKNEPYRTEKARIVGWRVIKDWIHSQLSLLEIEFANPIELFLPYLYNPQTGKTLFELFILNKGNFLEHKSS